MKSTIRKSTYEAMYRLLDKVQPVDYDCGRLCGAICCTCGRDTELDMGMYLLPGEEKMFTRKEEWLSWSVDDVDNYDFPESWRGKVYFIKCLTPPHCPREKRPLQCRFFPLAPHFDEEGVLRLILVTEKLPYVCPFIEEPEEFQLNEDFVKATYTVWKHLIRDPLIFDFVEEESLYREASDADIVYIL